MVLRDQGNEGHELLAPLGPFRAGPEGACGDRDAEAHGGDGESGQDRFAKGEQSRSKGMSLTC